MVRNGENLMKDFYLTYKKVGNKFHLKTNLTKKMLQNLKDYDDEWMLVALELALDRINKMGELAKFKYKEMCEKNGNLLYNAAMICNGITEEDNEMKNYELYAKMINSMSKKLLGTNLITD